MTTTLTTTATSDTINLPAASRCGLNETGICCKESETAHVNRLDDLDLLLELLDPLTQPDASTRSALSCSLIGAASSLCLIHNPKLMSFTPSSRGASAIDLPDPRHNATASRLNSAV